MEYTLHCEIDTGWETRRKSHGFNMTSPSRVHMVKARAQPVMLRRDDQIKIVLTSLVVQSMHEFILHE